MYAAEYKSGKMPHKRKKGHGKELRRGFRKIQMERLGS
jgi:hypothetical protein